MAMMQVGGGPAAAGLAWLHAPSALLSLLACMLACTLHRTEGGKDAYVSFG
jgi:hypothetical protein